MCLILDESWGSTHLLDKLKAEVLILIGDQQLYVQFCKFKRQYELQDSVLVIPGMFHWIAHLCLAICQLLDEWLFRPIVNDHFCLSSNFFSSLMDQEVLSRNLMTLLVPYVDMRANIRSNNSDWVLKHMGYFMFIFKAAGKSKYFPLTRDFLAEYQALSFQYKEVSVKFEQNLRG